MKLLVKIVVFMFLIFLSAPTIVSLMNNDDKETSVVYSSEEEMQKEAKDIKVGSQWVYTASFVPVIEKSTQIKSDNLHRHENVCGDVFLFPPEQC